MPPTTSTTARTTIMIRTTSTVPPRRRSGSRPGTRAERSGAYPAFPSGSRRLRGPRVLSAVDRTCRPGHASEERLGRRQGGLDIAGTEVVPGDEAEEATIKDLEPGV